MKIERMKTAAISGALVFLVSDLAASTLFPKSRYQGAVSLNSALTACAVVVRFRDRGSV
jgi:hypothetical protein